MGRTDRKRESEGISMRYDFTTVLDRRGMDAIAVDGLGGASRPGRPKEGFDAIPM